MRARADNTVQFLLKSQMLQLSLRFLNEPVKNHPQKAVSSEPSMRQLMAFTIERFGFEFAFFAIMAAAMEHS